MLENEAPLQELKEEERLMVDVVRSDEDKPDGAFQRRLFNSLDSGLKYRVLMDVAQEYDRNSAEACRLVLLTLKMFPEKTENDGMKLLKLMSEAESSQGTCVDTLRQMLIFDVLPLLLSPAAKISPESFDLIREQLVKSLEFYVENSWISFSNPVGSEDTEIKIAGILSSAASKFDWKPELFEKTDDLESMFKKINAEFESKRISSIKSEADGPIDLSASTQVTVNCDPKQMDAIMFASLFLFLRSLSIYSKECTNRLVLLENFPTNDPEAEEPASKKRKVSPKTLLPEISSPNNKLKTSFVICLKCIDLMRHASFLMTKEFFEITLRIGLEDKKAYNDFQTDSLLFKGTYEELIKWHKKEGPTLKSFLQLSSASLLIYDYSNAMRYCFSAMKLIRKPTESPSRKPRPNWPPGTRPLFFLETDSSEVIAFCIDVMITSLKSIILMSLKPTELGIGDLIVLTQYRWPKYSDIFLQCIAKIVKPLEQHSGRSSQTAQHKFIYPHFYDYVFTPDQLEEFMSLASDERLHLELKPPSAPGSGAPAKSMTTRGVNKGAKEEVKIGLMNQMKKSKTSIEDAFLLDFVLNQLSGHY